MGLRAQAVMWGLVWLCVSSCHSVPTQHCDTGKKLLEVSTEYSPQDGATVLLFHPCASVDARRSLAAVAHSCLHHFILTAHPQLSKHRPFALVSWGHTLEMSHITSAGVCEWLLATSSELNQTTANHSRNYNLYLTKASSVDRGLDTSVKSLKSCCVEALSEYEVTARGRKGRSVLQPAKEEKEERETKPLETLSAKSKTDLQNLTQTLNNMEGKDSSSKAPHDHITAAIRLEKHAGGVVRTNATQSLKESDGNSRDDITMVKVHDSQTDVKSPKKSTKRVKTDVVELSAGGGCASPGHCRAPDVDTSVMDRPLMGHKMTVQRTDEAVWAAAALGFLLVLLTLSVLHTRLYRNCRPPSSLYWRESQQDYESVAVCLCALFTPPCLGAPLLQGEQENVLLHLGRPLQDDVVLATKYIERFYSFQTGPPGHKKRSQPSFSSKLKDMQSFFLLNQTGSLDPDTVALMKRPSIGKYTSDLPTGTVDSLIKAALDVWANASPLQFYRSSSQQADIMVEFGSKYHGDNYPFDGPKGTLAHAFDPGEGIGGDVHFDEDEQWTVDSKGSSITAPYYPSLTWNFPFNSWFTRFFYPRAIKDQCDPDQSFDSVTNVGRSIFFFKGRYLWIKNNKHDIKEGLIHTFIPKINSTIDAAFWLGKNSTLFLFSGSSYWTVEGSRIQGSGQKISSFHLPASVDHIDAAVYIPNSGHVLFFTQDQYWRYNVRRKAMEKSNPHNITEDFPDIKTPISAALYKRRFIHFFVGAEVYTYDLRTRKVVGNKKANSWLGC
ncbi:Matrix metalloproteinase-18 [Bagarius yarrelli]|uniref:Matrix metalloproteinase-18 n=1 Tax=Bagarius yarrelli TaxID=175774 RepID=A0A556U6V7_BAGYA|nr:Matrix metalloproteinase-18 [Bagarius yarrelli]